MTAGCYRMYNMGPYCACDSSPQSQPYRISPGVLNPSPGCFEPHILLCVLDNSLHRPLLAVNGLAVGKSICHCGPTLGGTKKHGAGQAMAHLTHDSALTATGFQYRTHWQDCKPQQVIADFESPMGVQGDTLPRMDLEPYGV